jgi:hypothetical protein
MTTRTEFITNTSIGLAAVVLAALALQHDRGEWPFKHDDHLTIENPTDPFQRSSSVRLRVSGETNGARVWAVGINSNERWFPLDPVARADDERWTADINAERIEAGTRLCVVRVDDDTNTAFLNYLRDGQDDPTVFRKGIARPPHVTEDDCSTAL